MSLTAAALRLMAEKGLSALDIAEIAEAIEASTPKSSGAERQKRYRDRLRNERNERDVTSDVTSDVTNPLPSPSPSFPPDPQTNPTPAHPRDEIPRARKADDFPKPEWADPQVWADFMLNRKRKRMTNSATAYRGFLRDIEKHTTADWPPGSLLEHAAAKGWASINAPEDQDHRNELPRRTALRPAAQQSSRADRYFAACADAEAERGDDQDYPQLGYSLPSEYRHQ